MTYQYDPILGAGRDGKVTIEEQQAGFNAGAATQKAAFQALVSGAGTALIDAARADKTLTATEQQALRIVFSGALTADAAFDLGALRKRRTIDTQTSGSGRLLLKFGVAGTAFPVPKNETVEVQ